MSEPGRPCKLDEQARRLSLLKRIAGLERERNGLEQSRDALLGALRGIIAEVDDYPERFAFFSDTLDVARAAVARAIRENQPKKKDTNTP